MGAEVHGREQGKHRLGPHYLAIAVYLVLLLMFLAAPAVAIAPAGAGGAVHNPAVSILNQSVRNVEARSTLTVQQAASLKVPPTTVPVRQNRTTLIQAAKNIADRPKVTVPSGIFLIIVAIAIIGLLASLYLLIRRTEDPPGTLKKPGTAAPGNTTMIEKTTEAAPGTTGRYAGPAVPFPPSLEKRFVHPEFIGEGGLARVFRAQDAKTGSIVAVKVPIRFDEVTGTHFTRDIAFWQGLDHKNIIRILSSNILPVPYIEMEYAPSSLAAIPLPIPEEKAIGMIMGIARGIAYAHDKGIVHRDIKPENILLTAEGNPKITDWGLGKAITDVRLSTMLGFSPAYAAPEQIAPHRFGRSGPATDIYQLGMLLLELLTGAPAFRGEGMHDLNLAILEKVPAVPSWSGRHERGLKRIILRCLAKKPEDRYASVADLIRDLEFVQMPPE